MTLALQTTPVARAVPPTSVTARDTLRAALIAHAERAARVLFPDARELRASVSDAALVGVPQRLDRVSVRVEVTPAAGPVAVLAGDVRVDASGRPVAGRYGAEAPKRGAPYVTVKGDRFAFGEERRSAKSFADTFAERVREVALPEAASSFLFDTPAQPANFVTRGEVEQLLAEHVDGGLVSSQARTQVEALRAAAVVSALPDTLTPKQAASVDARPGARLVLSAAAAKLLDQALAGTAPAVGLTGFSDGPSKSGGWW